MSFNKKLAKDTINYGLGQVLPKVISFLLLPLYLVYLEPAEFGLIDLIVTTSSFLLTSMRLSLPGAISRFYFDFKTPQSISRYISTIYFGVIGVSVITGLIFLLFFLLFGEGLLPGISLYPFFTIILVTSFLNCSSDVQRRLLQVRRQSAYNAALNAVNTLIGVLLTILFVVVYDMGVLGVVLSTLITTVIFFIQAQFYLRKDIKFSFDISHFMNSLKFSLPLFMYHFLGGFAPVMSKSLLAGQISMAALGIFAIAYKFTQPLTIFSNALASAYTPLYYAMRMESDALPSIAQVKSSFNKIWTITLVLSLTIFIFSKPVLNLVPNTVYKEADLCLKILALGSLPAIFYQIIAHEIFFQKKTKIALFMNILSIILMMALSAILVKPLKEVGIALSMVVPGLINAFVAYHFSNKYHRVVLDWIYFCQTIILTFLVTVGIFVFFDYVSSYQFLYLVVIYLFSVGLILFLEKSLVRSVMTYMKWKP